MDKNKYFKILKEKADELPEYLKNPFKLQQLIKRMIADKLHRHKAKLHVKKHGGDEKFFFHLGRALANKKD